MKHFFSLLLILVLFHSCQKSNIQDSGLKDLDSKTKIFRMGFDTTGIVDKNGYYIVEGDLLIRKSQLNATLKRQASVTTGAPVALANQSDITIYIDNSIPTGDVDNNWRGGIIDAVFEHNKLLESNIRFRIVASLPADIVIESSTTSEIGSFWAVAEFPANGYAGASIKINFDYGGFQRNQKKYVIMHELGHCMGLRHTDWYETPNNENEFLYANGTTYGAYRIGLSPNGESSARDPNSLFRRFLNIATISEYLTSWDQYAISHLYPFKGAIFSIVSAKADLNSGYVPSVAFLDTMTKQIIAVESLESSSYIHMNVPPGIYDLLIVQMNNQPFTVSIDGYPTKTGQEIIYNNISVPNNFYNDNYFPMIIIDNQ